MKIQVSWEQFEVLVRNGNKLNLSAWWKQIQNDVGSILGPDAAKSVRQAIEKGEQVELIPYGHFIKN